MIVMKFGGTSVGSAERIAEVAELIENARTKHGSPVVVLSAMSGTTNDLIAGANQAVSGRLDEALATADSLKTRHLEAIDKLFAGLEPPEHLKEDCLKILDELIVLYKGISYLNELSKRSSDAVSGIGELLSSKMLASYMQAKDLPARWIDARKFMITDDNFGKASPLWDQLIPEARKHLISDDNLTTITQGFIGTTADGASTTLGRGGSDFTASILGVATGSNEIQIWTDVDGMMTADPRIIPEARVIPEVSFQEASELAYFGAKVLHPLTIKPAVEHKIPVRILNTLHPEKNGTLIKPAVNSDDVVRAVASKKGITAIFISSPKMLMSYGFLARIFAIFDQHQTPIDLISTSEISVSLTIDQTENLQSIKRELSEHGDVRVIRDVAIVSVVGRQYRQKSGIAGRVFNALKDINIQMISGGASDINLSFVVAAADADNSVKLLHEEFFKA